jgi:hypothetical protein
MVVAYRLVIDGRDVTDKWKKEQRLLSIDVIDKLGVSADSCTLEIDDREPHVAWPPAGAQLRLWLGASPAELYDLGTYTLDVPEASGPPHRLMVTGHAASFVSGSSMPMQTPRSRLWENVSLADLAETIGAEHGLTVKVALTLQGQHVGTLEQIDEGDLVFLGRAAEHVGARVRVRSGQLEVMATGSLIAKPTIITAQDIEAWHAPLGERLRAGTVVARWHSALSGKAGEEKVGGSEPVVILSEPFDGKDAARAAAQAALDDRDRRAAQLSLSLTRLRADLGAGAPLVVKGLRSEIDGAWTAIEVRHFVAGDRARTSVVAEAG